MTNYQTPLEEECEDVLLEICGVWTGKEKVWKGGFTKIMGRLRNALTKLENKRMGCITGQHDGDCLCSRPR